MTPTQVKKLDTLFQVKLLEEFNYESIIEGSATLIHHFIPKGGSLILRWWKPNGIPVDQPQHNIFHSSDAKCKEYENKVKEQKGEEWFKKLQQRKWQTVCKNIEYKNVVAYLNGEKEDYL